MRFFDYVKGGVCGVMLASALSVYADEGAHTLFVNGNVYVKADDPESRVSAFAINNGKVIAVGDNASVLRHKTPITQIVDLYGRTVMPGLIDAHGHYVRGALRVLFECSLPGDVRPEQIAPLVQACSKNVPEGGWVTGGAWPQAYMNGLVHRRMLDELIPNHPVFLVDDTGHNAYVNTRALEIAGLDKNTPNPLLQKDASGELSGVLLETAKQLVFDHIPQPTEEQYVQAAEWSVKEAHANGITAFVEASAGADYPVLKAYHQLDQKGLLSADVDFFRRVESDLSQWDETEKQLRHDNTTYASERLHLENVKIYLDGVPPSYNSLLLQPYEAGGHEHGPDYMGELRLEIETLNELVYRLDKMGQHVKMHAAGDGSVRAALDAVEYARRKGAKNEAHSIAHVGLVAKTDLPRFASLDVIADIAPPIWMPGPYSDAMSSSIGEARYANYIPTGDLYRSGALVAYGSDWPSISFGINVWPHLQSLVDRKIGTHQRISLKEALATVTSNAAKAMRLEHMIGTLDVGKKANFIFVDHSPYDVATEQIAEIRVLETYFEGQLVYKNSIK